MKANPHLVLGGTACGILLRPLHLRALQWLCRIIGIQTKSGRSHTIQSSHGGPTNRRARAQRAHQ
eukprot:295104-Prorocentrum_lima.AAC.1